MTVRRKRNAASFPWASNSSLTATPRFVVVFGGLMGSVFTFAEKNDIAKVARAHSQIALWVPIVVTFAVLKNGTTDSEHVLSSASSQRPAPVAIEADQSSFRLSNRFAHSNVENEG